MQALIQNLANTMSLSTLLEELSVVARSYDLLDHWQQGEFHHDIVVRTRATEGSNGGALGNDPCVLVVATNCNGGVKEVIAFREVPDRFALWHWRCPESAEFSGELPEIVARATTTHFFDPCALLADDARSELLPEHRVRQHGGGFKAAKGARACGTPKKTEGS